MRQFAIMKERGIDANEHILNLKADFSVAYSQDTGQSIRPMSGIREPDIFNPADKSYLGFYSRSMATLMRRQDGLTPAVGPHMRWMSRKSSA